MDQLDKMAEQVREYRKTVEALFDAQNRFDISKYLRKALIINLNSILSAAIRLEDERYYTRDEALSVACDEVCNFYLKYQYGDKIAKELVKIIHKNTKDIFKPESKSASKRR